VSAPAKGLDPTKRGGKAQRKCPRILSHVGNAEGSAIRALIQWLFLMPLYSAFVCYQRCLCIARSIGQARWNER